MLKRLVDSFQKGPIAFDTGEENGIGEVVPVRQGHGFLAVEGACRVEVPDDSTGLVLAHPEPQGQEVLDRVRPATTDSGRHHADDAAPGRRELSRTDGEARSHPPGLQGSCDSQEEDGHQPRSSRFIRGATAWRTRPGRSAKDTRSPREETASESLRATTKLSSGLNP